MTSDKSSARACSFSMYRYKSVCACEVMCVPDTAAHRFGTIGVYRSLAESSHGIREQLLHVSCIIDVCRLRTCQCSQLAGL